VPSRIGKRRSISNAVRNGTPTHFFTEQPGKTRFITDFFRRPAHSCLKLGSDWSSLSWTPQHRAKGEWARNRLCAPATTIHASGWARHAPAGPFGVDARTRLIEDDRPGKARRQKPQLEFCGGRRTRGSALRTRNRGAWFSNADLHWMPRGSRRRGPRGVDGAAAAWRVRRGTALVGENWRGGRATALPRRCAGVQAPKAASSRERRGLGRATKGTPEWFSPRPQVKLGIAPR